MTQDFAKPSTTRKPGQAKKKNGHTERPASRSSQAKSKKANKPLAQEAKPEKSNRRVFFALGLFFLLGAFAYGLFLLQNVPETHSIKEQTQNTAAHIKKSEPEPEKKEENRFNFYDLLPQHEVVAPKVEAYKFKEKSAPGEYYYIVQTGSFRNLKDAERQKAMIAFQGIKANIKSVKNDKGTLWHRVSTGPFYNRSKMNSVLDKLVSMRIQPLVKKIKKTS